MRILNYNITKAYPRAFTKAVLRHFGKISNDQLSSLIGMEIGVYNGVNAESIMKTINVHRLYLVDPYEEYSEMINVKLAKTIAHNRLKKYYPKIQWFYQTSKEAIQSFLNPTEFDFIYIDGAHDYKNVKQDIELSYPLLAPNGIIGGHDFANGQCEEHSEVTRAVIEFASKHNLKLYNSGADWWFIKGETWDNDKV